MISPPSLSTLTVTPPAAFVGEVGEAQVRPRVEIFREPGEQQEVLFVLQHRHRADKLTEGPVGGVVEGPRHDDGRDLGPLAIGESERALVGVALKTGDLLDDVVEDLGAERFDRESQVMDHTLVVVRVFGKVLEQHLPPGRSPG